jgi:hypothetical protein
MIGRMPSPSEARKLLGRLERAIPKRPASSVRRAVTRRPRRIAR